MRTFRILFALGVISCLALIAHVLFPMIPTPQTDHEEPDAESDLIARASIRIIRGTDTNDGDRAGGTLLHEAAHRGFVRAARYLLDNDARVDTIDWLGETPLHKAARAARCHDGNRPAARIVQMLIERGARIDALDCFDQTPLHEAAAWGRTEAIGSLLEAGAQVNAVDCFGDTPLITAAAYGNVDAAEKLLEHGASISMRNHFGSTPAHDAARAIWARTADWQADALLSLLAQHGADLNARDNAGMTPLDVAQSRGRPNMVDHLRQAGAMHACEME